MIVMLNIPSLSRNATEYNINSRYGRISKSPPKLPEVTNQSQATTKNNRMNCVTRCNSTSAMVNKKERQDDYQALVSLSTRFHDQGAVGDEYHPTTKLGHPSSRHRINVIIFKQHPWLDYLSKILIVWLTISFAVTSMHEYRSSHKKSRAAGNNNAHDGLSRSLFAADHQLNNPSTIPFLNGFRQQKENYKDHSHPKIVWLMSFPNSGTSFIIHMTREATNCTTATNYGLEGDIRDQPSVPAIQGPDGENGPWLELLRTKTTHVAHTILTKTHCKGFCSGKICDVDRTIHTARTFMIGCLTGNQGVLSNRGLRLTDKTYHPSLVKKAIHIFRHPLDNIVARFHLDYNEKFAMKNTKFTTAFPKNVTGFRRWCYIEDHNRGIIRSRFVDVRLRDYMLNIPCFNEFYRYTQWHNLAFDTIRNMQLPSMVLHYDEFAQNFTKARSRILDFLELPLVGEGIEFDDGKVYGNYYTPTERMNIRKFIKEFASSDTWEQLKRYSFEGDTTKSKSANINIAKVS